MSSFMDCKAQLAEVGCGLGTTASPNLGKTCLHTYVI